MKLTVLEPSARECGPCTICCRRLPIPPGFVAAEAKPAGTACPKLCSFGCTVYAQRPSICAEFQCGWLQEAAWPVEWRPHESGLLCLQEKADVTRSLAAVYELRRGALQSPLAAQMIDYLLEQNVAVVLIDLDENRRTLVPEVVVAPVAISTALVPEIGAVD